MYLACVVSIILLCLSKMGDAAAITKLNHSQELLQNKVLRIITNLTCFFFL